jgi:uncharacterized membrane protein YphA (DoxX/SURF4 family)
MKSKIPLVLTRLALGGLLLAAGWPKARAPGEFIRDIWNFHLVPESWAYWIAAVVPYVEIAAGLALITGLQRRGGHALTAAMLPVFLFFHASAWTRGLDISCGCFGSSPDSSALHPGWWLALILAMGVALAFSIHGDRERSPAPSGKGVSAAQDEGAKA